MTQQLGVSQMMSGKDQHFQTHIINNFLSLSL